MDSETRIYESHFGWTGKTILIALASLAFVAISFIVPLWLTVLGSAFFGICFLVITWSAVSHRVALRVDAQGITLGGSGLPVGWGYKEDIIPWQDIVSIVLWTQYIPPYSWMPYIGIQRRAGSPQLSGAPTGRWVRTSNRMIPWAVTPDIIQASRPISLWHLDRPEFVEAVTAFAPEVRVTDKPTDPGAEREAQPPTSATTPDRSPTRPGGRRLTRLVWGAFACAVVSALFFPIIFGPAAIILSVAAIKRKEPHATLALAWSIAGMTFGFIFGALVKIS